MLVFVRASRYDAGTGQFTQQDPIGIAGGANVYGFAGGDPVNFADPYGENAAAIAAIAVSATQIAIRGIAQLAIRATMAAAAAAAVSNRLRGCSARTRTYITYTLSNQEGAIYSGRASGCGDAASVLARRLSGHHKVASGFGNPILDCQVQGMTEGFPATRGREQELIDLNGGAQIEGGTSGNAIRGVSRFNPSAEAYKIAASEHC
jgi:uncharacterized protein RhaS with RHS repeats